LDSRWNFKYSKKSSGSAGIQTSALAFGGNTGSPSAATELYDGSTWTSNPTGLGTARYGLGGCWYTKQKL
jgi:hypothetical protein